MDEAPPLKDDVASRISTVLNLFAGEKRSYVSIDEIRSCYTQ